MAPDAAYWVAYLRLRPHPEGGYFAETYRSQEMIGPGKVPGRFSGSRCFSTAIYYLLQGDDFSAFHRLRADEVWHFYAGGGLVLHAIDGHGRLATHHLGCDPALGQVPQVWVPWGTWLAARPLDRASYALVGCTVAPGFEFEDFELARRDQLVRLFPRHRDLIVSLTRERPRG